MPDRRGVTTLAGMAKIHDTDITYNDGTNGNTTDFEGKALLVVNTASQCGFTPQYEGLQKLQDTYAERGFSVLGVPCNQFGSQESGSDGEIAEFCSVNFGVNFPLLAKTEVNGPGAHPLFHDLKQVADADGDAGEVKWNFEKFLISPEGEVIKRFRSGVEPESAELTGQLEAVLPR